MFSSHDTSLISSCQIQVPQVRILFCLVLRCFINDLISYLLCQLSGSQRLKAYGLEAHPWHREGWNGAREHQETSKHHVSKLQQTSNDMIRLMIILQILTDNVLCHLYLIHDKFVGSLTRCCADRISLASCILMLFECHQFHCPCLLSKSC